MPPPTTSWSTLSASDCRMDSLVDTLEPPTIATSGRLGSCSARPSASSSASSSGPAQATGAKRAMPCVVASARCAVPKASLTYTSHSAAILRDKPSSSFFSPTLPRQFSSSTTSPGSTETPSTQSGTRRTCMPSSSDRRCATGASESASVSAPSLGRPRCEVTMTAAPASNARRMPGTEARMRVSSLMRPASSNGTLRSARMKTRLPDRAPLLASAESVLTLDILYSVPVWIASGACLRKGQIRFPVTGKPTWPLRPVQAVRLTWPTSARRWCRACGSRSPTRCRTTTRP